MTEYQLGGSIEAEQCCVTFWGSAAGLEVDPSLGVGFLAHACSGGPITPNHTPQTCQKSVGLGGSPQFKDVLL